MMAQSTRRLGVLAQFGAAPSGCMLPVLMESGLEYEKASQILGVIRSFSEPYDAELAKKMTKAYSERT